MKKILLLLWVVGGIFSQLEAKCTLSDLANLRGKGFNTTDIDRICGTSNKSKSYHPKHKKSKKHHARSGGRVQWINLEDKQCSRYLSPHFEWKDRGCYTSYTEAQRVCRAAGGRLPSLNDFKRLAAKCGKNLRKLTAGIAEATRDCYYRNGVNMYLRHIYWTRTTVPNRTTQSIYTVNLQQDTIEVMTNAYGDNHVICIK